MHWNWWVFIPGVVVFTIISMFSRGFMNSTNVARYGQRADWRSDRGGAIFGSVIAGAAYSAIATVLLGLFV